MSLVVFQMLVPNAQIMKAHTAYDVLDTNEDTCALVRYMTRSGIKHQVRLHSASSLQCPILGDHKFSSCNAEPQILPLRLLQLLQIKGQNLFILFFVYFLMLRPLDSVCSILIHLLHRDTNHLVSKHELIGTRLYQILVICTFFAFYCMFITI